MMSPATSRNSNSSNNSDGTRANDANGVVVDGGSGSSTAVVDVSSAAACPARVAVIGCGPGGMFFLHALSERRRQLEASGDVQGLAALPQVTVMERNGTPGGVWCSSSGGNGSEGTMYEGLWINDGKELFEFFDHTFDEHFGGPTPAYLPRKDVLEYMMRRVTKHNPVLFDTVEFGTSVDKVEWDQTSQEFLVTSTATRSTAKSGQSALSSKATVKKSAGDDSFVEEKKESEIDEPNVIPRAKGTVGDDTDFSDLDCSDVATEDHLSTFAGAVTQRRTFDKVIWAAGQNSRPNKLPTNVMDSLNKHFSGTVVHSSHINRQLDSATTGGDGSSDGPIQNKRILLIGDSYSADDLALQFVKLGASKIYISSRNGSGVTVPTYTTSWPVSKNSEDGVTVEILMYTSITGGDSDNERRVWFDRTSTGIDEGYSDEPTHVDDIDLIVLCTGYEAQLDMFPDDSLKPWNVDDTTHWSMPKDWKMKKIALTDLLGEDIEPSQLLGQSSFEYDNFHRAVRIDNPNMMHIVNCTEYPLLDVDVKARMCLNYICEPHKYLPTQEEMEVNLRQQRIDSMNNYGVRYDIDCNFVEACDEVPEDTWYYDVLSPQYKEFSRETESYGILILARDMAESDYPLQIGTYTPSLATTSENGGTIDGYAGRKVPTVTGDYVLNETGQAFLDMAMASTIARYELKCHTAKEREWRTYRDDPTIFRSIFTGTQALPLPGKWLELDNEGNAIEK